MRNTLLKVSRPGTAGLAQRMQYNPLSAPGPQPQRVCAERLGQPTSQGKPLRMSFPNQFPYPNGPRQPVCLVESS